jgi:hypothetical protein
MTEQHPLTDEMCEVIATGNQWSGDIGDVVFRHGDMRAAYDWAIDCFSDWIRENGYEYVSYHYELGVETDFERMIADFNQAMRPTPQQQENN